MKQRLEALTELVSLMAAGVLLYRITNPDGPEPLELLRNAWADLRRRLEAERSYRQAFEDALEEVQNLPETETES